MAVTLDVDIGGTFSDGFVTRDGQIYRVAYDEVSLTIDQEGTRTLREGLRTERKQRARPYREFLQEWSQQRPPEAALKYFGPYPGETA